MNVDAYLPPQLRGATVTRVAAGLSGAGVYRVDAGGASFVLKIAGDHEDEADWRRGLGYQRLAAEAGLSPRIVHVHDEGAARAVVTTFVADRGFARFYRDPATHQATVALLGRTLRRLHALPLPEGAKVVREPHTFLGQLWGGLQGAFPVPGFARDVVERMLAEESPPSGRPVVMGHNDVNPSNLVHDGTSILLLDWATAGPMDPFYDLATAAMFLRMDDETSMSLLGAYDDAPCATLPARFHHDRRLAAALCGLAQLHVARRLGHPGATGAETLDDALALGDFYQKMIAGELPLGTPQGQWAFGLALLKVSHTV